MLYMALAVIVLFLAFAAIMLAGIVLTLVMFLAPIAFLGYSIYAWWNQTPEERAKAKAERRKMSFGTRVMEVCCYLGMAAIPYGLYLTIMDGRAS